MGNAPADPRSFPPEVELHTVKLACERLDNVERSLSHWDCAELARQLISDQVVETIFRRPSSEAWSATSSSRGGNTCGCRQRRRAMRSFAGG